MKTTTLSLFVFVGKLITIFALLLIVSPQQAWAQYATPTPTPTPAPVNAAPVVTNVQINSPIIVANGQRQYTITITATDANGAGDLRNMFALINYQGPRAGMYRGYVGWSSASPAFSPYWGANYNPGPPLNCTGGGYGADYNGYGTEYINIISCSTSAAGNTRYANLVVSFNTNFITPVTQNTLSGFVSDAASLQDGWKPFGTFNLFQAPSQTQCNASYTNNRKSVPSVYRQSNGRWYISPDSYGIAYSAGYDDVPVPADYNGDGLTDLAMVLLSTYNWYANGVFSAVQWGTAGDIPVPGDYNGDGTTDVAVYRPSNATWYVRNITTVTWGAPNDIPAPADYNGDGTTDVAVYRPSNGTWYIRNISTIAYGGHPSDLPVPADYNGDGSAEPAVYRSENGYWYAYPNGAGYGPLGGPTYTPTPGDFDGNGTVDYAVFLNGNWYTSVGNYGWGQVGDIPVACSQPKNKTFTVSGRIFIDYNNNGVEDGSDTAYGPPTNFTLDSVFPYSGLMAYWKMDEPSGTNVVDSTGPSTGTATSTSITTGKLGNSRVFTPNTSKIDFTDPSNKLSSIYTTVSAWVYPTTFNGYASVYNKRNTSNQYYLIFELEGSNPGTMHCDVTSTGGSFRAYTSIPMTLNQWNHVVCGYDGTKVYTYVNGQFAGSTPSSGTLVNPTSPIVRIGQNISNGESWNGRIDEVAVWNRALTNQEILAIYQQGTFAVKQNAADGNVSFTNLFPGTYSLNVAVPNNYYATTATTKQATIGPSSSLTFGIIPSYSISGDVFVDTDKNGTKNGAEANYTAAASSVTFKNTSSQKTTLSQSTTGAYASSQTFPLLNNLVSYWSMDETSGTAVQDNIGPNNATATGAQIATGKIGNGRRFAVSTDQLDTPAVNLGLTSMSISAWVYPTASGPTWNLIASQWQVGNAAWNFSYSTGYQLHFNVIGADCNSGMGSLTSSAALTPNQWNHVAVTRNGTTGTTTLYVNNAAQSGFTATGKICQNSIPIVFGRFPWDPNQRMIGTVDEVGIWNTVLSSTDITTLYNAGAARIFDPPLKSGTYTVSYTSLPSGYIMTYPLNGPPPFYTATVGPSCSVDTTKGASCSNGNIQNLNFGILFAQPWWQTIGGDVRIGSGVGNPIPPSPSLTCSEGAYVAVAKGSNTTPGIVFSGSSTPDYGFGQASPNPFNWSVGNVAWPELFAPSNPPVVRTSYGYMMSSARVNNVPLSPLSSSCTLSNCTLPANLANGVYQATGNVNLNAYTFPANKNYVFLMDGNLTIRGNIIVPQGSTATFSVSGDIIVESSVGEAVETSSAPNIEGMFSADKSFIIQGQNNCSIGPDKRINISGAIVVKAGLQTGSFTNQRDLCSNNQFCPVLSIVQRPDFLLNAPKFIKYENDIWQEVAP